MKSYKILLPKNVEIDIFNLPEDFDNIVLKTFAEYTNGTSREYRDVDRLSYIDVLNRKINKNLDASEIVDRLLEDRFSCNWRENGELLKEEDVYCAEFMYDCCDRGMEYSRLNNRYGLNDHHICDAIHEIVARIIKIVFNATEEEITGIIRELNNA